MKIIISERQHKIIEQVHYTPEKISEILAAASKDLAEAKEYFRRNLRLIAYVTIYEVFDQLPKYEQKYAELTAYANVLNKKHSQYFNVIDMYEIDQMPENVRQLDVITTELDNIQFDIGKINDILENLMENTKRLAEFLKARV